LEQAQQVPQEPKVSQARKEPQDWVELLAIMGSFIGTLL
jgi:hypothetical protein